MKSMVGMLWEYRKRASQVALGATGVLLPAAALASEAEIVLPDLSASQFLCTGGVGLLGYVIL